MQTQGRRHANVQPHVFHHFFAIHLARVADCQVKSTFSGLKCIRSFQPPGGFKDVVALGFMALCRLVGGAWCSGVI